MSESDETQYANSAGEKPEAPATSLIPPEPEAPPPLERILEGMLFVGGEPLTVEKARASIRGLTTEQFEQGVDLLNQQYKRQGRPYTIQKEKRGYLMTLRSRFRTAHAKLYGSPREAHLSQAAIDALALVAYRQPITRAEIDTQRGIESFGVLRQLVRRGLIAIVQHGEGKGKEAAYVTTQRFLEFLDLHSLADLPRTQDVQQI